MVNSTWREQRVVAKSKELTQVDFVDTKPNQIYIYNSASTPLYMGIEEIPTEYNKGQYVILPKSGRVIGRPFGIKRLYLYNQFDDSRVLVESAQGEFSMNLLKEMSMNLDDEIINKLKYDGIINGFNCSLPAGENTIGKIQIENSPEFTDLKEKVNDIIKMIASLDNRPFNFFMNRENHDCVRRNVIINMPTDGNTIQRIAHLSNDGSIPIELWVDDNLLMTVLKGEVLSDIDITIDNNLTLKMPMASPESPAAYRLLLSGHKGV